MKFFIPGESDASKAEELYQAIRKYAARTMVGYPPNERRIWRISFRHRDEVCQAIVGSIEPMEGGLVVAILESRTYLVCTSNRGVLRGIPLLVDKQDVIDSEDFESSQKSLSAAGA